MSTRSSLQTSLVILYRNLRQGNEAPEHISYVDVILRTAIDNLHSVTQKVNYTPNANNTRKS